MTSTSIALYYPPVAFVFLITFISMYSFVSHPLCTLSRVRELLATDFWLANKSALLMLFQMKFANRGTTENPTGVINLVSFCSLQLLHFWHHVGILVEPLITTLYQLSGHLPEQLHIHKWNNANTLQQWSFVGGLTYDIIIRLHTKHWIAPKPWPALSFMLQMLKKVWALEISV